MEPSKRRNNPKCRVLVVDDNADAAESLRMLLQLEGHEVLTAREGAQAVRCAREFEPHVILLDLGMPGMTGYDVAREVRALGTTAVLIALTGWAREKDRQSALAAGFDHHVAKPVDPAWLLQLIEKKCEELCEAA